MSKLPILMYHNVQEDSEQLKAHSIHCSSLEDQLKYLVENGYTTFHFSELETQAALPKKSIIITFDDVTVNQLDFAVPLLEKYNLKATFFIPFHYLGKTDLWNNGVEPIMTAEQLKSLPAIIELGYHSYKHRHYAGLTLDEVRQDFEDSVEVVKEHNLTVYPALAYPYGNFPRKDPAKSAFFEILRTYKMKYAVRIGNRISQYPFSSEYEINRIDIKGTESMFGFKWKLKVGKLF
ncbi:polysaccharide deacetylase family protein [Myroides odoratimimus]|uniref:polysaccharide deacetylase family protein n=1 Tax=Myroides odoratimimus TaxID=76832 RepID=UPI002577939E|nr:polysaccharide deacetylase family protein [Myroides odoratimimus]MDM1500022.1 polysaccharide deacetylase family protein [Myroides odoratimimus]